MLSEKTVFIIGAGASHEAGLPVGKELTRIIAGKVAYHINGGGGDQAIIQALHLSVLLGLIYGHRGR